MTGGAHGVTWPRVAADAAADPEQRTAGRGGGQAAGLPGAVRPWAARVFFGRDKKENRGVRWKPRGGE
jgi:hypothetical protein